MTASSIVAIIALVVMALLWWIGHRRLKAVQQDIDDLQLQLMHLENKRQEVSTQLTDLINLVKGL